MVFPLPLIRILMMDGILSCEAGQRILAMGNEAVTRGALEAGLGYFATYPGTPASEIGDTLISIQEHLPRLHGEYSTNEHVALHGAIGASFSGVRAMAAMKHVGMNVASEPLHFLGLTGVRAGLVVVVGSDPGATCSTSEQDDRWYSLHTHAPILEPSNIQEAKDFTKEAFELSERFSVPFIVNLPSRLAHNAGDLVLGEMPAERPATGHFVKNPVRYFNLFQSTVDNHRRLLESMDRLREDAVQAYLNRILPGSGDWGLITSSVNYEYLLEALDLLGLYDLPILKIGLSYPLSEGMIRDFLRPLKGAIIVEDLEGFLEFQIKKAAYDGGLSLPIKGKDLFPRYGELNVDLIGQALAREFGVEGKLSGLEVARKAKPLIEKLPPRTGTFCAGCPHRATIYSLMKATRRQEVYGGDIGCLTLSGLPPHYASDWVTCMNCGLATSQGVSKVIDDQKVITIVGDSTFFHSGVPALINAVQQDAEVLLLFLDNKWIAMTGHQPSPTTNLKVNGEKVPGVDIRELMRALGVKYVRTIDPFNVRAMVDGILTALETPGFKVIIAERECSLQADRRRRRSRPEEDIYYDIDPERCQRCGECYMEFGCPAIRSRTEEGEEVYYIEEATCTLCGACKNVCPNSAITRTEVRSRVKPRELAGVGS